MAKQRIASGTGHATFKLPGGRLSPKRRKRARATYKKVTADKHAIILEKCDNVGKQYPWMSEQTKHNTKRYCGLWHNVALLRVN